MQDDAIKKFDLVKAYELERSKAPLRDARAKLEKMTSIRVSREGVISVTTTAYDPKMAAEIANFYVENLDRLNTALNVTEAGRSRLFLEGRVAEAQKALKEAEDRLRAYQSKSKAVVMEGQTKAAIEGAARLEGQILAAEVQLKTLETYSTARNPDVIKLKESIEEMRRQLKRMEYGRGDQGQRPAGSRQQAGGRGELPAGRGQQAAGRQQRAAGNRQPAVPSPDQRKGRGRFCYVVGDDSRNGPGAGPDDPGSQDSGDDFHVADPATGAGQDRRGEGYAYGADSGSGGAAGMEVPTIGSQEYDRGGDAVSRGRRDPRDHP